MMNSEQTYEYIADWAVITEPIPARRAIKS